MSHLRRVSTRIEMDLRIHNSWLVFLAAAFFSGVSLIWYIWCWCFVCFVYLFKLCEFMDANNRGSNIEHVVVMVCHCVMDSFKQEIFVEHFWSQSHIVTDTI